MDHPVNQNLTGIRGDVPLLRHVIWVGLVQRLALAQLDLDLVDVLSVLGAHEEAQGVVAQIADYEGMSELILDSVSDDLCLAQIYLLLLLRIYYTVILVRSERTLILSQDLSRYVTGLMGPLLVHEAIEASTGSIFAPV